MPSCRTQRQLTFLFLSPPNSKCLHLLMGTILFDLQFGSTHSSLSTIFFVVLAYYYNNDQRIRCLRQCLNELNDYAYKHMAGVVYYCIS